MSDEPIVKGSWPLVEMRDGRPLWHVAGTNPPEYAPHPALEALWQVVEEGGGFFEEQRQVVLDAGRGDTVGDV